MSNIGVVAPEDDGTESGTAPGDISVTPQTPCFLSSIPQDAINRMNASQQGFVMSIRVLEKEDRMVGAVLLRAVSDMFPPASLFNENMPAIPALYSELRNFLDTRGCHLTQHSSRRIMMTLATNLYEDDDDQSAAVEIVRSIIASGRRNQAPAQLTPTQSTTQQSIGATPSTSAEKVAHNMAMRLKDRDKKFSGDVGECWQEYVDEYRQVSRDYY